MADTAPTLPKVDFIGIGAQKAATTWLSICLAEHPSICVAAWKETNFFTRRFGDGVGRNKGPSFYRNQFAHCTRESIWGEFSVDYLANPLAPQRIADTYPDVKFIVVLRDPVARAVSHIRHLQTEGVVPKTATLDEAIAAYPEVIDNGRYTTHLKHYFSLFDQKQFLILLHDDVGAKPNVILQQTFKFLGVDTGISPRSMHTRVNSSKSRSAKLYKPLIRLHERLSGSRVGRVLIVGLKKVGVTTGLVEGILGASSQKLFSPTGKELDRLADLYQEEVDGLEHIIPGVRERWLGKNAKHISTQ